MQERGIKIDPHSPQYQKAKQEYARLYQRMWRRQNKNRYVWVKIMFPKKDFQQISRVARRSKLPVATLIKKVMLAYTQKQFFVPEPERLPEAIAAINRIGNLINQQTRWIHTHRTLTDQHYQDLLNWIATLRNTLRTSYTRPIPFVKKQQEAVRQKIQAIIPSHDH